MGVHVLGVWVGWCGLVLLRLHSIYFTFTFSCPSIHLANSLDPSKPGDLKEFFNMSGVGNNTVREGVLHICEQLYRTPYTVEYTKPPSLKDTNSSRWKVVSDVHVKCTASTWLSQLFLKVTDLSICACVCVYVSALCCISWMKTVKPPLPSNASQWDNSK